MLMRTGNFKSVDLKDADTLHKEKKYHSDILENYDSCLVVSYQGESSDHCWPEQDGLGDLLASAVMSPTHAKQQCGIVLGPLTHLETIGGKWRKHKLSPLLPGRLKLASNLVMAKPQTGHAVLADVGNFAGMDESYHVSASIYESCAKPLARWSDGFPLLAILDGHPLVDRGRVIGLNFMPAQSGTFGDKRVEFWGKLF